MASTEQIDSQIDKLEKEKNAQLQAFSKVSRQSRNPDARESIINKYDSQIANLRAERDAVYDDASVSDAEIQRIENQQSELIEERNELEAQNQRALERQQLEQQKAEIRENTKQKIAQLQSERDALSAQEKANPQVSLQPAIQKKNADIKKARDDEFKQISILEYKYEYGADATPAPSDQKFFEGQISNRVTLIDAVKRGESARTTAKEYAIASSKKTAQSESIQSSEQYAKDLINLNAQKSANNQKDVEKVNTSIASMGLTVDDLQKAGDDNLTFRAPIQTKSESKTTEEKTDAILKNYANYKADETNLSKPQASNYIVQEVPEPKKGNTSFAEYYKQWNEANPQYNPETPEGAPVTIDKTASANILNHYLAYKAGLTPLTDDISSNKTPSIVPAPKAEQLQNEKDAVEYYENWYSKYGDITRKDVDDANIFTEPTKLNLIRELNMQQKNMENDPITVLKPVVNLIEESKLEAETPIPTNDPYQVKVVRDDLIILKTQNYAVAQTPEYTVLTVFPTEKKQGYSQVLQVSQKPSTYIIEGDTKQERNATMWDTAKHLNSISPPEISAVEKKSNKYTQDNLEEIIKAEKNLTNESGIAKPLFDQDLETPFSALKAHSTEAIVIGRSAIASLTLKDNELDAELMKIEKEENYKYPTLEASAMTDIINKGKELIYGEPSQESESEKFLKTHEPQYVAGSVAGSFATSFIPLGKLGNIIKPLVKTKTAKTAQEIASKTIPKDVKYSVEVAEDTKKALVWVGTENKQTAFDVIKIDTRDKTVEFIKAKQDTPSDKLISQIRMETRSSKTPAKLKLETYDSQGKFDYSQGYTGFKNIWELSKLEKAQKVKPVAEGTIRPLEDVRKNPELYREGAEPVKMFDSKQKFLQYVKSLEGGDEPRIAGKVGYFVEKPDGTGVKPVVISPDDLAKLTAPDPTGKTAKKTRAERDTELINKYFREGRTYEKTETKRPYKPMKPFDYADEESELSKLIKSSENLESKQTTTKTKPKQSIEDIKNLIRADTKAVESTESIHLPQSSIVSQMSRVTPKQKTRVDSVEISIAETLLKNKFNVDVIPDEILKDITKQQAKEDLIIPEKLITDNVLNVDVDYGFIPKFVQKHDEPELFIPPKIIPEFPPPEYPPFRFPLFFDDDYYDTNKKKKLDPSMKRSFVSNVPFDTPFGLYDAPELTFGTESKIEKIYKKMIK